MHVNGVIEAVGALAAVQAGYQLRTGLREDRSGSVILIQPGDVNAERSEVDIARALRFSPSRDTSKKMLKEGDVLFMGKGPAPFGCAVHSLPGPTVASGFFFVLRPKTNRVLPEYLAWALNRKEARRALMIASGAGVSMPVVRKKELEDLVIPLPSLETQQRIMDLHRLMTEEKNLMCELAEQRKKLIRAVCEKWAASEETDHE